MCDYCSCRTMPLIDDLGDDHARLLDLARTVRQAITDGDRPRAEATLATLLDLLRVHTEVEETSVFAELCSSGELDDDVRALQADHDEVWATVSALDGDPAWDVRVVRVLDDLAAHIGREEYDLFPATLLAIGPSGWERVEAAAARVRRRAG